MDLKKREHCDSGADNGGMTGGRGAGSRLTPKQREQQRRRQRALELRSEGKTLAEIADELGWSRPSGVSYALKVARKELSEAGPAEELEMQWRLNMARLTELFSRTYPLALGGVRNGEHVPPDLKYVRPTLRIIAEMNAMAGLKARPEEAVAGASHGMTQPGAGDDPRAVMTIEFDMPRYEEALRRARQANDERLLVDDQAPAGYVAPHPSDAWSEEPELITMEPNSVDPQTGQPLFDPRVALRSRTD